MTVTASEGARQLANSDFRLYSKSEYLADITARTLAAKAGDRVSVISMAFEPDDPGISPFFDALCTAAGRGVQVLFLVDAYNFLINVTATLTTPGPLFFHRQLPPAVAVKHPIIQALARLEAAGGRTVITNQPGRIFTNPFAGRSHLKTTLINDRIYIGGCNLAVASEIDVMAAWDDAATANWLHGMTEQMHAAKNTGDVFRGKDIEHQLDAKTILLVDAGKPRQSIIYQHALQLIDEAEESVYITCQYFPNHVTARHLEAARRRGAKITIIYNHPGKDTWPFNLLHRVVVRLERLRNPRDFFDHELPKGTDFLHAKVIATESAGMVGSHNYVRAGVNWGTAEIALLRHDPAFAKMLATKVEAAIEQSASG